MNQTGISGVASPKHYWKAILGILRFRIGLFSADSLAWIAVFLGAQILSLANKYFFNLLEGKTSYPYFGFWSLISLIIIAQCWNIVWNFSGLTIGSYFFHQTRTLLVKNMLLNIFKRPGAQVLKESSGDSITRIGDADFIPWYMGTRTTYYVALTVFVLVSVVVMFRISFFITAIALIPFLLVVIIAMYSMHIVEEYRTKSRTATGHVKSFINELFGSIQAVKVACAEKSMIRQFDKINKIRRKTVVRDVIFFNTMNVAFQSTMTIGTGIVLIVAGKQIQNGSFSIGDLALFIVYFGYISEWSTRSGALINSFGHWNASINRMLEFMDSKNQDDLIKSGLIYMKNEPLEVPTVLKTSKESLNSLEVEDLCFRYPDSDKGIKDISFRIKKHTLTIITGRIGSGKTTLVQNVLGLRPADSGIIKWNGKIVDNPSNFFVPPHCAYAPQVPRLQSMTLRDNITLGQPVDDRKLQHVLYQAVLEQDVATLENGVDTLIGPKGVKLSGGQIQRAAAARMFFTKAELMVFDDLSSALDVDTEHKFWERVLNQKRFTYLAVSHSRTALSLADNIIVLKNGAIDAQGKLNDLMEGCEEMRFLWEGVLHQ